MAQIEVVSNDPYEIISLDERSLPIFSGVIVGAMTTLRTAILEGKKAPKITGTPPFVLAEHIRKGALENIDETLDPETVAAFRSVYRELVQDVQAASLFDADLLAEMTFEDIGMAVPRLIEIAYPEGLDEAKDASFGGRRPHLVAQRVLSSYRNVLYYLADQWEEAQAHDRERIEEVLVEIINEYMDVVVAVAHMPQLSDRMVRLFDVVANKIDEMNMHGRVSLRTHYDRVAGKMPDTNGAFGKLLLKVDRATG